MESLENIINSIVSGTLIESDTVELKSSLPIDVSNIAKAMVGMANNIGGFIIIGVREVPHGVVPIGVDANIDVYVVQDRLLKYVNGVDFTISKQIVNGLNILVISVEKSTLPAYYSRETSPERQLLYLKRRGACSIVEEKRFKKVYKYMSVDAFITSLYCGSWRFFEPSIWNDEFERRFYCANYQNANIARFVRQLYATCVTREKNSEAAWKVYAHGQGLSAHCVQIELDIVKLREQLRLSTNFRIGEESVEYKSDFEILELHKKNSKYYNTYFANFSLKSFLKLLSLKRNAYSYEQEIRIFAIPATPKPRNMSRKNVQHEDLAIAWKDVIMKVRVDMKCSDAELTSIQQACIAAGINPIIKNYNFLTKSIPEGLVDVEFERFDIDEMPGIQRITIK